MNKTITILKNCTQETLNIIAQNVIDVSEQKTGFADIRDLIIEEEVIDVSEQKTGILCIRFEISSSRNTGVIISARNGATA